MSSLGIAIDGGRYVRVDSSIADFPRTVKLRTLQSGQDTAKLELCAFRRKGPVVRRTVIISGLSGNSESPAELRLMVQRYRFALWLIEARKPDGSLEEFRVRTGIGLWFHVLSASALLILTLLFIVPILVRGFSGSTPLPSSSVPEGPVSTSADDKGGTGRTEAEVLPGDTSREAVSGTPEVDNQSPAAVPPAISPSAVTTVFFQPESAVLSGAALDELRNLAEIIPENISLDIGGHCADYGTEKGRMALSLSRAEVVSAYLLPIIPNSVIIQVQSWGSSRPLSRNPGLQDKNRRVEIIVEDESE